ncbi:YMGG-like glycine zipper-containing protein [Benzoatithermus flavus]|uniref:YMGG-like glycine zipper-containing protein n=1 Tax=Benzoatithermus flavus TaxID=3108223 RepID=A0ABU8XLP6_9PROT
MQRWCAVVGILGLVVLSGCGTSRFDRTVTGAGIGAGTGAVAGLLLGPVGIASGALVGAGVGGVTGAVTTPQQIDLGRPIYR